MEAQSLAVKRAEVEFHNFASLGAPSRPMSRYPGSHALVGSNADLTSGGCPS
jgi:hypothetical protein